MKKVVIINPIVYTSETKLVKKVNSIKDTMIYDLCLAFKESGYEVVLFAAEPYRPEGQEEYPFEIKWAKCILPQIFWVHRLPVLSGLYSYIKKNKDSIDMIVSSEVFSVNSLIAYRAAANKVLIWHELAKHNALLKKIPSKFWYNIVVKFLMKQVPIVARSKEARAFIGQYCKNVHETVIDHGVNLSKFHACEQKDNSLLVCSQLIPRKRIDGILQKFCKYLATYDSTTKLYIAGSGEEETALRQLADELGIKSNVVFLGKISHDVLQPMLARSKALLINTIKDNSMISIVESIAVGTPILTTDVPLNSEYIKKYQLGIALKEWDEHNINEIVVKNDFFVENCLDYRNQLSTKHKVAQFLAVFKDVSNGVK